MYADFSSLFLFFIDASPVPLPDANTSIISPLMVVLTTPPHAPAYKLLLLF